MAIKKYVASGDTTIVNAYRQSLETRGTGANAGAADVMEVFSIYGRQSTSSAELSRALVKFPIASIKKDRTAGSIPSSGSVSFYMRLFNAKTSKTVPVDYTLMIQAVSQSWQEGIGLDLENYKDVTKGNPGANWMSASNSAYWQNSEGVVLAGGSFHTRSLGGTSAGSPNEIHVFSQSFTTGLEDLEVDITPLVEQWIAETWGNYGVGVHLTASQEAKHSGSAPTINPSIGLGGRYPGYPALDRGGNDKQNVLYNPSGSTESYYTKRFFARKSQYWYKRPVLEARWDSSIKDDRSNFFFSSSLASADSNLNTIYFYNYVRGKLAEIPNLSSDKSIHVSIYSGSAGGFYANQGGGDGSDVPPSNYPVSGTTGSVQVLSPDNPGHVTTGYLTVVTGGIVSTGIYSASFAFTGSELLESVYDVWFKGGDSIKNATDATTQYFTGTIKPHTLYAAQSNVSPVYYLTVTNMKNRYRANEDARFNLYIRNKNWSPTIYTVATSHPPPTIIESASYKVFRVLDALDVIPYGTGSDLHTMMSYDMSGNYFDLNMRLLEPGYEYGLQFTFYEPSLGGWSEQDQVFKFRVEEYEY